MSSKTITIFALILKLSWHVFTCLCLTINLIPKFLNYISAGSRSDLVCNFKFKMKNIFTKQLKSRTFAVLFWFFFCKLNEISPKYQMFQKVFVNAFSSRNMWCFQYLICTGKRRVSSYWLLDGIYQSLGNYSFCNKKYQKQIFKYSTF